MGASIYDVRSGWGGEGSQKSRRKEQNQLIYDNDKGGEGVKKSENFAESHIPGGAASCSEGFVVCFLKVPHACWGSMAAATQPNGPGGLSENILQNLSEQVAAPPGIYCA